MKDRADNPEALSPGLKSRQWAAAKRRREAAIQAEVRRLARSARRASGRRGDPSGAEVVPPERPAA